MPQLDLSALNGAELRRLLDSVRERGHAAQSYQILEEMARRREDRAQRRGRGGAAERRIISVDFSDPLEPREETWEADATPEPAANLTLERQADRLPPKRSWSLPAATFVAGAVLGVAGGAWYASSTQDPPPPPAELTALQAELTAPPAAPPSAPAAPEPVPETPPDATTAPPANEPAVAEAPAEASEPSPEPVAAAGEPETPADAACGTEPTPADRTICAHPRLQRLQEDLRRAYAEALDAHEDRAILRERQLAWRDARSAVTDPDRLAALYEQRIRKLDSATADARSRR